jgi:hypothetical protein
MMKSQFGTQIGNFGQKRQQLESFETGMQKQTIKKKRKRNMDV